MTKGSFSLWRGGPERNPEDTVNVLKDLTMNASRLMSLEAEEEGRSAIGLFFANRGTLKILLQGTITAFPRKVSLFLYEDIQPYSIFLFYFLYLLA